MCHMAILSLYKHRMHLNKTRWYSLLYTQATTPMVQPVALRLQIYYITCYCTKRHEIKSTSNIVIIIKYVPYSIYNCMCYILLNNWQYARFVYTSITIDVSNALYYKVSRQQVFFSSVVILWDNCHMCCPSLTKTSSCSA